MDSGSSSLFEPRTFGRTGRTLGRLGIAGGFGAPAQAIEMAFERGCNYFYHGSLRRSGMTQAIKNLCAKGKREELYIVCQLYTRWPWWFRRSFYKFLKNNSLDYVDAILLGWYNNEPKNSIMDAAAEFKDKKLARHIQLSGHERKSFPKFAKTGLYDAFHIRYNAVHKGAEKEIFPDMPAENRPGIAAFTVTSWQQLLKPGKTPPGEKTPTAIDCYRFALSNPNVDIAITGAGKAEQIKENLAVLDMGPMGEEELAWMRRVGDHIHG